MEKMRKEFEAWHIEQCKANGMDWIDLSSELDRDGDGYVYADAQCAWRGWRASRAALCVQMPRCCNEEQDSYRLSIIDSLDDAGVRHE